MFKANVQFNDFVSLAVMLLMVVALVAGQADANAHLAQDAMPVAPIATHDDRINIDFNGYLGDAALKVSIAIVSDLNNFRGEDE
jgi:hypothetical protein